MSGGLFYFGFRYYDPEIAIFTATDPMDEFWNSYTYTGGNPIIQIDPTGGAVETLNDNNGGTAAGGINQGAADAFTYLSEVNPTWAEHVWNSNKVFDATDINRFANMSQLGMGYFSQYNITSQVGGVLSVADMAANFQPQFKPITSGLNRTHQITNYLIKYRYGDLHMSEIALDVAFEVGGKMAASKFKSMPGYSSDMGQKVADTFVGAGTFGMKKLHGSTTGKK